MNVYSLKPDGDRYQHLNLGGDEKDLKSLIAVRGFVGTSLVSSYEPLTVKLRRRGYQGQKLQPSDFPLLSTHIPVFSEKAAQILRPHLEGLIEMLPLKCNNCQGETFYAINVTCIKDVLDMKDSDIVYFTNTDRILNVNRMVLDKNRLPAEMIFRTHDCF